MISKLWLLGALVSFFPASALPGQSLLLVGGGNLPQEGLERFVAASGGPSARILVVTWATDSPAIAYQRIREALDPFSPSEVVEAPRRPLSVAKAVKFKLQLAKATGLFFTGGDQNQ